MSIEDTDYHPTERFGKVTGRRFLIGMILSFGLIFAVNGFFIFKALSTFDGIEIDDAYQRGRAYNKDLAAMEAQKALGWKADLSEPVTAAGVTHLAARFTDRAGLPLTGLTVKATFWRPPRRDKSVLRVRKNPRLLPPRLPPQTPPEKPRNSRAARGP